ncbi:MAG: tetratricopeptide repeat protein [Acidobacteria bacterium]|nr:tetratricopeptide repeat protein [Acidobacteriota bacterium]
MMKPIADSARTTADSSHWFWTKRLAAAWFFFVVLVPVAAFGQEPEATSDPGYTIEEDYEGMWQGAMEAARAAAMLGDYDIVQEKLIDAKEYAEHFGPDDMRLAITLNNLGMLYQESARYKDAEPLAKRVVEIVEKALPPENPIVAQSLGTYAKVLRKLQRDSEAVTVEAHLKEVQAKAAEKQQEQEMKEPEETEEHESH